MHQRMGRAGRAVNAFQIAPDFEGPARGKNFRRADGAAIVEIHHFDMGVPASLAEYADFIILHENPLR